MQDAVEVAVGDPAFAHAGCYRTAGGAVWCWGGSNLALNFVGPQPGPWAVTLPGPALQLVSSSRGHCALLHDGDAACWRGFNGAAVAERVGLKGAVKLAAGRDHLCALARDGAVRCWGDNLQGATGQPPGTPTPAPTPVPGIRDGVDLAAGGDGTCVRHKDGAWSCFGDHALRPATTTAAELARAASPARVIAQSARVALGSGRLCFQSAETQIRCATAPGAPAETLELGGPLAALSVHGGWGCAAVSGEVRCFGAGPVPQVSDSDTMKAVLQHGRTPWTVGGLDDATGLSVYTRYACATTRGGHVRCWGYGGLGELGDGEVHDSPHRATWLIRYAPALLPEPAGGVNGCTADEDSRRSCRAMGVDCRLFSPPGYWYIPPSGVDYGDDPGHQKWILEELSRRPVPACMCSCADDYTEAQRAFQKFAEESCCPP